MFVISIALKLMLMILASINPTEVDTKEIICTMAATHWSYFNKTLTTCWIINQSFRDASTITSPSTTNLSVEGFNIDDNKLVETIPNDVGNEFPELMALQVRNCSVSHIDVDAFKNMPKLQDLILARNNISSIESGTFRNLPRLRKLQLNDNKIEGLSDTVFNSLSSLLKLGLGHNNLRFLNENVFANLISLRNISLHNNGLETIPLNLFKKNKHLEFIWLHENNLKHISFRTFNEKINLKYVNMDNNNCVKSTYWSGSFDRMKHDLESNCLPLPELTKHTNTSQPHFVGISQSKASLREESYQLDACKANLTSDSALTSLFVIL